MVGPMRQDQKTVEIMGGIHGTLAAVYGATYKAHTMRHFPAIVKAYRYLRTVLNTGGKELVVFKPIRGGVHGCFFTSGKIFIDPRGDIRRITETLAHEMVHAEQYNTGKMERIPFNPHVRIWQGNPHPIQYRTYHEYRALPWEAEAFARQEELAAAALKGVL
jgi:hypothetical protein